METGSIITIIAVLALIYIIIKFIISPIIKIITGVVVILIALYVLNKFFNVNFNAVLGPLSTYINLDGWISWAGATFESWVNAIKNLFSFLPFINKK
jgi:hypothetical protein